MTTQVLVVRKTTNLEWYGSFIKEQVAKGRLAKSDLDRLVLAHSEHYESLARLRTALTAQQIAFEEISRENDWPLGLQFDVVITVGGDGTLLAASHHMGEDGLIVGIRSSQTSVGHLCAASFDGIDLLVRGIKERTLPSIVASRLVAEVCHISEDRTTTTVPILNDFLFTNANPAATTRYRLHAGGTSEEQKSSGIWVATATGSTAAIMAAGGSPAPREDRDFQYVVREIFRVGPRPPKLVKGSFDPDHEGFEIENRCEHALLALDGQHGEVRLGLGDRIKFRRGPSLRMVPSLT